MNYYAYEMAHAFMSPVRFSVQALRSAVDWPMNPMKHTVAGKNVLAACEVFENVTRRYGKPEFGIKSVKISSRDVPIRQQTVLSKPFCDLLRFERDETTSGRRYDPKVLVVAPMSGHYATLLRGTVEAMLPEHDVYITDWLDARTVPLAAGLSTSRFRRLRHRFRPLHRTRTHTLSPYASRRCRRWWRPH